MLNSENFIYQNLEYSVTYLGYSRRYRVSQSFFDLIGSRADIDLHNLYATKLNLSICLSILRNIFIRSGVLWIIAPQFAFLKGLMLKFDMIMIKMLIKKCVIWSDNWIPGVLTNRTAFKKIKGLIRYPSVMFYPSYSLATSSLSDGTGSKILQIGVADSNSLRRAYSYTVPANEKTQRSNNFITKTILNALFSYATISRQKFLFDNTSK